MWTEPGSIDTEQLITDIRELRNYGTLLLETSRKLRDESNHIYSQSLKKSLKNKDLRSSYASSSRLLRRGRIAPDCEK